MARRRLLMIALGLLSTVLCYMYQGQIIFNKTIDHSGKILHPREGPNYTRVNITSAPDTAGEPNRAADEEKIKLLQHRCPSQCQCVQDAIVCEKRSHIHVPKDLPDELKVLDMSNNNIHEIRNEDFANLIYLRNLILTKNKIRNISLMAFDHQANLTRLDLSHNKLETVPPRMLKPMVNLQRLFLNNNRLAIIPNLGYLTNLQRIGLNNNRLTSAAFPIAIKLPSIQAVVLNDNPITEIKRDDFRPFVGGNLTKLALAQCKIHSVEDGAFSDLKTLLALHLSRNKMSQDQLLNVLKNLSESSLEIIKLDFSLRGILSSQSFHALSRVPVQHLFIKHGEIDVIEDGTFSHMPGLRTLEASYSDIHTIEEMSFSRLTNLTDLKLDHNQLTRCQLDLPEKMNFLTMNNNPNMKHIDEDCFSGLENIKYISVAHCSILTLDKYAFNTNRNLEKLDLSNNKISGSALSLNLFDAMEHLVTLDLSMNNMKIISDVDELFSKLSNLKLLDMSNNQCEKLPPHIFDPLKSVTEINLQDNNLGGYLDSGVADSLFHETKQLNTLILSGNNIVHLPLTLFKGLYHLEELYLDRNQISTWVSPVFEPLSSLQLLNLSTNSISTVTIDHFNGITPSVKWHLENNQFHCHCDLTWFVQTLHKNKSSVIVSNVDDLRCHSPVKYHKHLLMEFNPDDISDECHPWPWFIILCTVVITMLLVGVIMYWKRWTLLIWFYRTNHALKSLLKRVLNLKSLSVNQEGKKEGSYSNASHKPYDAYLAVCSDRADHAWVVKNIMLPLSDDGDYDCTGNHKIWYSEWHMSGGKSVIAEIPSKMRDSDKIIIYLTEASMKDDKFSKFDIPNAFEEKSRLRDSIIILVKCNRALTSLPKARVSQHRLEVPHSDNTVRLKYMVDKLEELLGAGQC